MKTALTLRADFSKDGGFFSPRFLAVGRPQTSKPNFVSRFFRSDVMTMRTFVSFTDMFLNGDAFKVFRTVVRFVFVDVVNVLLGVKILKPASSHNAMHKPLSAKRQISSVVLGGRVRMHLSKNFPAARNSVKMVKNAVFNSVHRKAFHVGSSQSIRTGTTLPQIYGDVK